MALARTAHVAQRTRPPALGRVRATMTSVSRWSSRLGGDMLHASTMVAVYAVLLLALPARLVVRQIGASGTPANLFGLLLLLWWLATALAGEEGRPGRRHDPVSVAMGVFTIAVLMSYAAGMARGWYAPVNVRQKTDDLYDLAPATAAQVRAAMMLAADRGLISYFSWLGVCLVATRGLRTWHDIERCIKVIVYTAGALSLIGILQFFTGLEITGFYRIPGLSMHAEFGLVDQRSVLRRVMATASHPIEFGVVIAACFPLALHLALFARSRLRWSMVALIGFAASLSVSRSAVLVIGLALTILWCSWPIAWRRRLYWTAPAAIVAIRILAPGVVGTLRSLFTNLGNDTSVSGRTEDYGVVLGIIDDGRLLGRGMFTFVPRYYRIVDNQLLVILVELGVIGLVCFFGVVLTAICSARGARLRATDEERRHLALVLSASIAGLVLSYATFDAFGFAMAAGFTFLLFGLAGASWRVACSELPTAPSTTQHERRCPRNGELSGQTR